MKKNHKHILICHRSIVALTLRLMARLFLIYAIFLAVEVLVFSGAEKIFTGNLIMGIVYKAICCILILETVRKYFNELYVFGKIGLFHIEGRLSMSLSKSFITYRDITDSEITQGIAGRIFNYGNIGFGTAGTSEIEILLRDISKPHVVIRLAQRLIGFRRKGASAESLEVEDSGRALRSGGAEK